MIIQFAESQTLTDQEGVYLETRKHPFWGRDQYRPYVFAKEMPGIKQYILCRRSGKTDAGEYERQGLDPENLFRSKEDAIADAEAYFDLYQPAP